MNSREKKLIIVFGLLVSVMLNVLFIFIFYVAYFNGGASMVTVNTYGEGNIEAILIIPSVIVFLFYCLYLTIHDFRKEIEKERKPKRQKTPQALRTET
ncbi:MAG: hypothetical protein JXA00_00940 [Candidatus Thermoplasmatota archaeon]|nr:hypothetical protein [Candidatus Thermoplasmatota archaeon]